ncbi:hypothetical protein A2U01_0047922 [Trifolium medium]|uniref:Uncharacterized protein n=1 Tax=Trifolium medium TaxID=97028 RepID=A0A392QU06_9FABA|nr:hypothetical protein [Trifolium medium]
MKRGNLKAKAVEKKKKSEKGTSTSKQSKAQKKLKFKQEESSDSGKTYSDWAEFLKSYDPKEDTDSEKEVTQKLLKTKESKKEDYKFSESDHD